MTDPAFRKERYRWESEALKIVVEIKRELLPAMEEEEEEGGWILGRILDLAQLIEASSSPSATRKDGQPE